jgi:hypothetical protein
MVLYVYLYSYPLTHSLAYSLACLLTLLLACLLSCLLAYSLACLLTLLLAYFVSTLTYSVTLSGLLRICLLPLCMVQSTIGLSFATNLRSLVMMSTFGCLHILVVYNTN